MNTRQERQLGSLSMVKDQRYGWTMRLNVFQIHPSIARFTIDKPPPPGSSMVFATIDPSESEDGEQSDAGEDSDREEPEYKVQAIVNSRFNQKREHKLQVKWMNYSKRYNEWHIASELSEAQGLLNEYIAKNPIASISLQPQLERYDDPSVGGIALLNNVCLLRNIFSTDNILNKFKSLRVQHDKMKHSGKSIKVPERLKALLLKLSEINDRQNHLSGYLVFDPLKDVSKTASDAHLIQSASAQMVLIRANDACSVMSDLAMMNLDVQVLSTIICWQECRSLLIIKNFYFHSLPCLANILFHAHQYRGEDFLEHAYTQYTPLVMTVTACGTSIVELKL
ncbi:hypothetical protein FPV67DRAFT_1445828 [Lyophyllum atratum]|nr:hypothetical protein FPV67DRAFT_1445828 [Lyophyllum atratum]